MMKLYSIKHRLVFLLLLLSIGTTSFAQILVKNFIDYNTLGAQTYPGSIIKMGWGVINNTSNDWTNVTLQDVIPLGTTYIPGTTKVENLVVSDISGVSPVTTTSGLLLGNLPAGASIGLE